MHPAGRTPRRNSLDVLPRTIMKTNAVEYLGLVALIFISLPTSVHSRSRPKTMFFGVAFGVIAPVGNVSGMGTAVRLPETSASSIYSPGVVGEMALGGYIPDDDGVYSPIYMELALAAFFSNMLTTEARQLAISQTGQTGPTGGVGGSIKWVLGTHWVPHDRVSITLAGGPAVAVSRLEMDEGSHTDTGWGVSVRLSMEWRPTKTRFVVRPLIEYLHVLDGVVAPNTFALTVGFGAGGPDPPD